MENGQYWRARNLRQHVAVIEGKLLPTMVFENATYLNVFTKKWIDANIWIYEDRIVYVGDEMPNSLEGVDWYDCTGQYFVPGYIEPHAHPFQVYNPEEIARYSGRFGTTTLINDNLALLYLMENEKAFELIEDLHDLPVSMFWWARYDSQTLLTDEDKIFNSKNILSWVDHPSVVQGGELTNWPKLLKGSDQILFWIQETLKKGKRVEGHLPGASRRTLTKLKLLGISADHEAMTAEEVTRRLELGYHAALRYSSIRPDLPNILKELIKEDFQAYDQLMFTTDGSTPAFCENGLINVCLDIAIKAGLPIEEAYRMASYNVAKYYGMDGFTGSIAPGRLANLNMLYEKDDPNPLGVIAKGKWLVKDGVEVKAESAIDWPHFGLGPLEIDWSLDGDDFQYSIPIGLQLENDVIMKPYAVDVDITLDKLPAHHDVAFLNFLDKNGKWRVNTVIKGYTQKLGGLASSYSTTDDIILIGKDKQDIEMAFNRMKEIGGGIVLIHDQEVLFELPLHVAGSMYAGEMTELIAHEKKYRKIIQEAGYQFDDPLYSLLFLCATHLPYIRVTQLGIVDVMKREVIVPANMR